MYYVIQENIFREQGFDELIRVVERVSLPYSIHKVVPFVGEIIPDIDPPNPVIVFGAYTMLKVAARKGWMPGSFATPNTDFEVCLANWGNRMLNASATVHRFDSVPQTDEFFMRPSEDSKAFAGKIFDWAEYDDWRHRIIDLGENYGQTLICDTRVIISEPREILREYRLWVVDGRIVTSSLYKIGDRVRYDSIVDPEVLEYGQECIDMWQPARAFCLDVCMVEGCRVMPTYKIVEVNCLNAAGFYEANIGRLVEALEGMDF